MGINTDEALGKLARRYASSQQRVAGLRATIDEKSNSMTQLVRALQRSWLEVVSSGEVYSLEGGSQSIPHDFLSSLPELLEVLKVALEEKGQLEDCLRQAGLDGLIK